MNILTSTLNNHSTLRFRRSTLGPEIELVNTFLHSFEKMFGEKGFKLSIFIEPYLDIGFPDIVGVLWRKDALKSWSKERLLIGRKEIRLLNHLSLQDILKDEQELSRDLGFTKQQLLFSLEKLNDANLITHKKSGYKSKPIDEIFCPKKIISIEAKISDWKSAFKQARLNHWFSSQSYVLFPGETAREDILKYSKNSQVGLILGKGSTFKNVSNFKPTSIPSSYGSWLINEWIGQQLYNQ